jgi:competence protein ComEC
MHYSGFTMFRLLLPFAAGIAWSVVYSVSFSGGAILASTFLLLQLPAAFFFRYFFGTSTRWVPGLIIYLGFFLAGIWQGALAMQIDISAHYSDTEGEFALISIREPAKQSRGRLSATVAVDALMQEDTVWPCRGNLRLSLYGDSLPVLLPGQQYLIPARFREIRERNSAGGFNYSKWLARQGVRHQAYLHTDEVCLYKDSQAWHPRRWGRKQQERLRHHFYAMMQDSLKAGLAAAMIIGEKSGLDEGVSADFRKSGVVHVLCVSGMHTATVYGAALFLLHLLLRPHRRRRWMDLIPLAGVILFALLTGLAPSVTRAAAMLSLYTLSRMINRKTEGLNILAGAAFLMLMIQAEWLFSAGFQLSFLAVAAIMTFTNPLMTLLSFRSGRGRKWLGGMAVVSVVAQAGTSGVSLFHFHAFPLWFLPSNLLSLPLATLSIYTGILSLLLQLMGLECRALVGLFILLLEGMQQVTAFFASLPGGYPEHIRFTSLDLCFFYLLLLLLLSAVRQSAAASLTFWIPMVLIFWSTAGMIQKAKQGKGSELWLRMEQGYPVVLSREGRKAEMYALDGFSDGTLPNAMREWARWAGVPQRNLRMVDTAKPGGKDREGRQACVTAEVLIFYLSEPWLYRPAFPEEQKRILITDKAALQRLHQWLPDYPVDVMLFDASVSYISKNNAALLVESGVDYALLKWNPLYDLRASLAGQGQVSR